MKKVLKLAAILAMASSTALAASNENNYYTSLSGVIGKSSAKISDKVDSTKKNLTPKGVDAAVGAYLTPEVRAEVAFNYLTDSKTTSIKAIEYKEKVQTFGLMANAYYDFNANETISPYVMAGVGVAKDKVSAKVSTATTSIKGSKSKNQFAWQVGTGVSLKATENVKFDIGYRFRNSGHSAIKFDDGSSIKLKPAHLLLAGFRFEF